MRRRMPVYARGIPVAPQKGRFAQGEEYKSESARKSEFSLPFRRFGIERRQPIGYLIIQKESKNSHFQVIDFL